MFESATVKLTLWYVAIVMAISVSFSTVIYAIATHEIDRGLHWQSERIIDRFPGLVERNPRLVISPEADPSNKRLLGRLIVLNLLMLIGSGLASYWLARRTLEPIEQAHRQQKRFTADVSHELRTPLTALRMQSEVALLNQHAKNKALREVISSNLEEVTKLEAMINNLLSLSRLEADEIQHSFTSVNSQSVINAALEQIEPLATKKKIALNTSGMKHAVLHGDETSLVQLLVILLDNAVKFSPDGATIHLTAKTKKGNYELAIKDNGSGIAKEDLEHIFDRFYQADTARAQKGTGLGLSIAQNIANLHQGTITIKSRPGQGSTAIVNLPLEPSS